MSISTIQNFYKETITRAVTLTGATNIYVSSLPTPSEGYVVISPSSSSLREIVYYTAKGTDSNGTYLTVTLANRGLGGTTAQTHTIGEPVRMNVTAEHIKEISDAIDQIMAAGAQDASTTTKGITKLSVAPVSATEPIAVGTNDPRVPTATQIAFIQTDFGDGSDGDASISSPTTLTRDMYYNNLVVGADLNTAQFRVFVKGTLSGTGKILVGPGGNGGNASGATGGAAGSAVAAGYYPATVAGVAGANAGSPANNGNNGNNQTSSIGSAGVNGGNAGNLGGAVYTGGTGGTITAVLVRFLISKFQSFFGLDVTATGALIKVKTSASGGSGAGGISSIGTGGGGGGSGAPGGILGIFAKTITGSFSLEAKGGNGGNGANGVGSSASGGGGGAPGNGGYILLIYAVDNNWTGTASVAAGSKGTGGTGVGGGSPTGADSQDGVAGTFSKIQIAQLI